MNSSINPTVNADTLIPKDVLFYVLNSTDTPAREAFLSKLLKKINREKRLCDVRFDTEDNALRYDLTLWNIEPHSFIAHSVQRQTPAPIQLYGADIAQPCQDVLINLHPEFFAQFGGYQRTIEILDQSDYLVKMGRERYRAYKQQGIEPTVHKIGF
jgi:DNA polymerase-3 subunit chi